jgi:hypothetical protein
MSNDVFISCKNLDEHGVQTRDAQLAAEVYNFLTGKGLSVFLSSFTLEQLGAADYAREIDSALDSASVLLAIGTSADHLNSEWVRYEWNSFANDIRSRIKPNGRLFTYIEGMEITALPRTLRQTQTFVHCEGSFQRLYNFINKALPPSVSSRVVISRGTPTHGGRPTAPSQKEKHAEPLSTLPTVSQPTDASVCPPGAVFISYASADRPAAEAIARQIEAAGCPVWFDRDQLMLGANWENELKRGVMETAGVFLSLISKNTEKKIDAYYIWERNWAFRRASRLPEFAAFYLPVRIDGGNLIPENEPIRAKGIQAISISDGVLPPAVLQRICQLVRAWRKQIKF